MSRVRPRQRLRRAGLAWQNVLAIARAGRLSAPYGAPFEVVHEAPVFRLRRYPRDRSVADAPVAPLLLVPPLMIAAEVYDISPEISAIAFLQRAGVDVWLIDFGRPEREVGGMNRTLDDHVRAVADAIERVRAEAGRDIHLAGYSQGGMFCYQAAALRRGAGLASIVTFGSPVDLHRALRVDEGTTERLLSGLGAALAWPLAHTPGLPGILTATGFKLLSFRKEAMQLLDFVKNLHDREALEKREARRRFLGGGGFVAWPGPAFRKFIDDLVVDNRMAHGGFVIDGHTVSLADLACPILYFVGERDELGRPAAVRGIRRACPHVTALYEIELDAGHFGLVVGAGALAQTWPRVVAWMRWRDGRGAPPPGAIHVRAATAASVGATGYAPPPQAATEGTTEATTEREPGDPRANGGFARARALVQQTAQVAVTRLAELTDEFATYLDNARWQVPRLAKLRNLHDELRISPGKALADQARDRGDRTCFLFRGRAFDYAEANRRVDAVVRGLLACGVRAGEHIGVMMTSRPSHLSVVTALSRLGAVAVLISPAIPDDQLAVALVLGEATTLIVDPDGAARARAVLAGAILVLGGVGEVPWQPGQRRVLPPGVIDLEAIVPDTVALPAWYRPDPGRARELAMVFVTSGDGEPPRAVRVTNRRWAVSALGAAAAAMLTPRDTVYCCLPLYHPSGTLVAFGSALISGARLALATTFSPETLWDEVRRYGVSVVYYAGEMCRRLVDAAPALGEAQHPVRLFAGSGLRKDVWRRLVERFGPVGVLEMYASSEASVVLANARGIKLGSVGRPLPGSPDVAIVTWSAAHDDFARDASGRLIRAGIDEPGMLIAELPGGGDPAPGGPRPELRDAFAPGDRWLVTGDLFQVDAEGDYWFVDRRDRMIATAAGPVAATRIEDALYQVPGVALCIAGGADGPVPIAAIELAPSQPLDPALREALSRAALSLPAHARPRRIRVVARLAMSGGFRPLRRPAEPPALPDDPHVLRWDAATLRYAAQVCSAQTTRRSDRDDEAGRPHPDREGGDPGR